MEGLDLTDFFQTKEGSLDFSNRLATLSEEIYKSDFNLEKSLTNHFGIQKKDKFISILRTHSVNTESTSDLKKFLTFAQEEIKVFPVLSIKLAFDPNEKILKAISEWFILNIKKQVLLEIIVDPKLVAGCDISYKGEFKSMSVKPKLDQIIKDVLANSKNSTPATGKNNTSPGTNQNLDNFSIGR
ncbi:MAG TPA: hypothetical protein VM077_01260 [Candidatus Limnocylindrales bacterium]|nr:hypothetical protein [Candidatus Limnocylindrales bacterium]